MSALLLLQWNLISLLQVQTSGCFDSHHQGSSVASCQRCLCPGGSVHYGSCTYALLLIAQQTRQAELSLQPWLSGATSCCTLFSSSEMRTKSGREESSTILVFGLRNFRVIYFHFSSTIGIFIKHCWKLTIQTREKALLWGDSSSFSWINSPYIETRLESPQRLMQQSYPCPP